MLTLSHKQTVSDPSETFENIAAKGENAHEQFLSLPQCFQPYSMIKVSFMEFYSIFTKSFQSRPSDLLNVG